jgi:hypothetical protein
MGFNRREVEQLGLSHLLPPTRKPSKRLHERFRMNKTESNYAETLEAARLLGEIRGWEFEKSTFVLAPTMTFTPDFRIEALDRRYTFVDVKGAHTWEDATVKIKAAAVLFPWHRWQQVRWISSMWKVREFPTGG